MSNADQQTAAKATLLDFGGDRVYDGLWEHSYFKFFSLFSKNEENHRQLTEDTLEIAFNRMDLLKIKRNIGCLRTRVRKQSIIALYFESETVLKFYNLKA